jgi:hypothetical protein
MKKRILIPLILTIVVCATTVAMYNESLADGGACGDTYCNVDEFSGSDDFRIEQAITAALQTDHKTVYFPGRVFTITQSIGFPSASVRLRLIGESANSTILRAYAPEDQPAYHLINIDRLIAFDLFDVEIHNMKLCFTNSGAFGGHGIRIGNGWQSGRLLVNNVKIWRAKGYGVGIQNCKTGDFPANNVTLSNMYLLECGQDAIDTKVPEGINKDLSIFNMTIDHYGLLRQDGGSSAGLDISYDGFYIKGLTIVDMSNRPVTGVRFRTRDEGAAKNGILRNFYIKVTGPGTYGVAFEPENSYYWRTENITIKNFKIKNPTIGISVTGDNHVMKNGCVLGAPIIADDVNNLDNRVGLYSHQCPDISTIGSTYSKTSDVRLIIP